MNPFDFDSILDVPLEQWHAHGVILSAVSANSDGRVNSFIAIPPGWHTRKVYGWRKHEFKDGAFTGRQWFTIEPA